MADQTGPDVGGASQTRLQRLSSAALFLFAFVGFVASIIAVLDYFDEGESESLRVEITPSAFETPLSVAAAFREGQRARRLVEDLEKGACEGAREGNSSRNEAGRRQDGSDTESGTMCLDSRKTARAIRWLEAYSQTEGTLYKYEIANKGSKPAQQIRIGRENVGAIQLSRSGEETELLAVESGDYFELPDLNPNESITVTIWTLQARHVYPWDEIDDAPSVTFSGSKVHTIFYRRVPNGWWNVYDSFKDTPAIIIMAVIIAIAIGITLAIALIIGIANALIKGEPLASIFKDPSRQDTEPEQPQPPA